MIPYCAALSHYRGGRCEVRHANRATFAGGLTLTVPVEGGRDTLKRLRSARALTLDVGISDHGRWQHRHLGALEATYGRAPFFGHYFDEAARIITGDYATLGEMNAAIDAMLRRRLDIDRYLRMELPAAAIAEARRLQTDADPRLSMLHYLFTLGPEAIFLLLPAF